MVAAQIQFSGLMLRVGMAYVGEMAVLITGGWVVVR